MTYDDAGRTLTITRGSGGSAMTATIDYDAAGRVTEVDYGNGAKVLYGYDSADRLTSIQHKDEGGLIQLQFTYTWTINNWVASRVEQTPNETATVDFDYDHRGRLIAEERRLGVAPLQTTLYRIEYEYDQLGNRLRRTDPLAGRETLYYYDLAPDTANPLPPTHATRHNRLLNYRVFDTTGATPELLRTVCYTYYKNGQASNITIKDESGPGEEVDYFYDLSLYYWSHGPIRYAVWSRWLMDELGGPDALSWQRLSAREFRSDSARGRYMSTQLAPVDDPNAIDPFSNDLWTRVGPVEWTDCVGDTPQADGEVEQSGGSGPFAWTQTWRYFGLGGDQTTDAQGAATATSYWHEDLIGSRSMLSDDDGDLAGRIAYTAFGELLDASGLPGGSPPSGSPRYQYAAAHGYESDLLSLQGANADLPPITPTVFSENGIPAPQR